jgi:hypothetical protein
VRTRRVLRALAAGGNSDANRIGVRMGGGGWRVRFSHAYACRTCEVSEFVCAGVIVL